MIRILIHNHKYQVVHQQQKKRQAPKPPEHVSPTLNDQQVQPPDHHESQESLTDSAKQKRKAPTVDDQQIKVDIEAEKVVETTVEIVDTTQNLPESHSTTPIYSQIQKTKESPYSTVKSTPHEEIIHVSPTNYSVDEIVQAGIAEPPPTVSPVKPAKKSTSTDGLVKIINDHNERAQIYQASEKEPSYFRVAKSRQGKFETDDQGFVNTTTNIFDLSNKEKSPTPIQLEVTERTTHISVTVESDRKQLITRASPIPQQTSSSPPTVAPKPLGKTITEYRTIRRTGADGETTTTTTVHTETIPPPDDTDNKQITENVDQTGSNKESIQQADGSENLNKE